MAKIARFLVHVRNVWINEIHRRTTWPPPWEMPNARAGKFPRRCFLAFFGNLHFEHASSMSPEIFPFMPSQESWLGRPAKTAIMRPNLSRIGMGVLFQR
jgi:hypothetical protein